MTDMEGYGVSQPVPKLKSRFRAWRLKGGYLILNLLAAPLILLPLLYAVSVAFMPAGDLFTTKLNLFPTHPTWTNYSSALESVPLGRFVFNSFVVASLITLGQVVSCALAAFSFSFLRFRGREWAFMLVMSTMMIPGEATIVSNYLMVSGWQWIDTYQVLIVPYLTSAMGIFLFRQFFDQFPMALYESARLCGCSNWRFLFSLLLPLSKPAVGAMAVYTFLNAWNMYLWPLLVTGNTAMRTVQIGVGMLDNPDAQSITLMMAGVVIVILPSILVFALGEKQLVRGMFAGAVKG
ncbi:MULTISPECIES: carbohydrate ABC transporter permease [Jonquetella]|nr:MULTISPECIES: carbohydrate ABC transporter permease [Jonquetella]EEX48112.1 ABC transporter, permease protein [Jonquetella anthropi E3_33 E1]